MAVLVTAHLPFVTKDVIDAMRPVLDEIRHQKGFIIHTNGMEPDGWRVVEVWDSQADFQAWFEAHVRPALPEGTQTPVIAFDELNDVVTA